MVHNGKITFYNQGTKSQVRVLCLSLSYYIVPKGMTVLHEAHKDLQVVWQMVANLEVHKI